MSDEKRKGISLYRMPIALFVVCLIIYAIFHNWWNPTDFQPFSYWNLKEGFPTELILVTCVIAPFILGQLHWFGPRKESHISDPSDFESWIGIMIRSLFAGIFEELSFRSVLIYVAMAAIVITNKIFNVTLALTLLILMVVLLVNSKKTWLKILVVIACVSCYVWIVIGIGDNPIFYFYKNWYARAVSALFNPEHRELVTWLIAGVGLIDVAILIGHKIYIRWASINSDDYEKRIKNFFLNGEFTPRLLLEAVLACLGLSGYIYLMLIYIGPVVIFQKPELMVWGIISCTISFRDAHNNPTLSGALDKVIFSYFMIYIAFTYGLMYAILGHFLYDAILLSSVHLVNVIKRRAMD